MADTLLHTVSLCTGVGMLDVGFAAGLEYLGIRCRTVLYAEREAYAAAVLLARMEEGSLDAAPVWCGDFTQLDGRQFRGVVDCVVAGFPCQDLSVAGKRAGLDGERSGLFFEVLRFACDCGARWLFLENVSAIASAPASVMDGTEELEERAAARVMGELADCGWDAEWLTLSASDVGASHKRERWFCLAWKNLDDAGRRALRHDGKDKRPAAGEVNEASGAGGLLGNAGLQRIDLQQWPHGAEYPGTGGELVNAIGNRWGTRRMPDGKDDRDFTSATGEIAVVNPECARWGPARDRHSFHQARESEPGIGDVADTGKQGLQGNKFGHPCNSNGGGRRHMDQLPNFVAYSPLARQIDDGEKSSEISQSSPRRLNPLFAEWLMGWPKDWTNAGPSASGASEMGLYRSKLQLHLSCLLDGQA